MSVLRLEIPDDLLCRIEELAQADGVTVEEKVIQLLEMAVARQPAERSSAAAILADIERNQFRPDPDGPDVVEMLREDRSR